MFGEGRADDEAQVIFALRVLLARIGADLERCGKRAGTLRLRSRVGRRTSTSDIDVPLATPTADERAMFDVHARQTGRCVTFVGADRRPARARRCSWRKGEKSKRSSSPTISIRSASRSTIARSRSGARRRMQRARALRRARARRALRLRTVSRSPKREMFSRRPSMRRGDRSAVATAGGPRDRSCACAAANRHASASRQAVLECAGPWRVEERPRRMRTPERSCATSTTSCSKMARSRASIAKERAGIFAASMTDRRIAYAELHAWSNFTFLEGGSHPEELIDRAAELDLAAIALTDRDGLYGTVRFAAGARQRGSMRSSAAS